MDRAKDVAMLDACAAQHLYPDIERMGPRVIVPLGAFACRAILGADFDLETGHGIPILKGCYEADVFPMFHPALGIHEPKRMLYIRTDWHRLRSFLAGRNIRRNDPFAGAEDYLEVTHESEVEALDPAQPLACDTESSRSQGPFCLTYSQRAGSGRLIKASNLGCVQAFQKRLQDWHAPILFHNWLYDWSVVEAMGLSFPHRNIVDTISLVFHLGNLPQGLKALAYRELGMEMEDFDDVVTPHSSAKVLDYYRRAQLVEWPKPDPQLIEVTERLMGSTWKLYKPQSMSTKLKRFFTDYRKNPAKDVFKMFEDNWVDHQAEMEALVGPYPGKCITHVPFDKVLHYACRDADALIRLYPVLLAMRKMVRKKSQEWWRVA
jgi:hypothetical protein